MREGRQMDGPEVAAAGDVSIREVREGREEERQAARQID